MFKRTRISSAAALAVGGLAVFVSVPALAQEAQRIEITGSNLRRIDSEQVSPVQVITNADLVKSGYTTVNEVLQNITANGQGMLSQSFNQAFAGGASGVSLRGLTVGATLVLIDGRRMAPYPLSDDGQRPFVDISSIPFSVVERIEILKDGASAVYGSDAIAGVVNVILKKSFSGTQVSFDGGMSKASDGTTLSASIIRGFEGSNFNGYFAAEFRTQDQILLKDRSGDWLRFDWRPLGGIDLRPGARNAPVGSPRLPTPYFQIPGSSTASAANFSFAPGCTYVDMRASNCTYENTWAQLQPKQENINLIGRVNFNLGSDWTLGLTGSWFNHTSQQTRRPANVPFGSYAGDTLIGPGLTPTIANVIANFQVPANYPFNTLGVPANIRALVDGTRPRVDDVGSDATRIVAELNGTVAGWDVNAAAGYTKVKTTQTYRGYPNIGNLYTALNSASPATRWSLTGGNSQALIDFVTPTVSNVATNELNFIGGRASRDLLPLAGGPLQLGVGVDFRSKKLNAPDPDPLLYPQLSGAYAIGSEKVTSVYAEVAAPILKSLELDAAVRYDHYNTFGNSTTPKVGFKFTPVKEFGIRGTVSRGFRAPSATENGTAGSLFSFNAIRDPQLCGVSNPDGTPNLTAAANVPAFCSFNPTYLQGTTKNLQPEKSKSVTFGLIFEPIKDWSTTLDYYNIELKGQIVPAAAIATFDPLPFAVRSTPQVVTFGDGSTGLSPVGPIQYVDTPYVNGQTTKTSGLEFETRYKFKAGEAGNFNVGLQFSHMINYDQTINGITYKLAGTHGPSIIGGNTGNPRDRMQLTLGWDKGPLTVTTTANRVGSYDVTDPASGFNTCIDGINGYNSQFFNGATPPEQFCKVPAFTTVNLNVQYKADKALTLRASVQNLFNKQPPVDLQTYGGTGSNSSSNGTGAPYNPSLHQAGAIGRFITVGLDYKF